MVGFGGTGVEMGKNTGVQSDFVVKRLSSFLNRNLVFVGIYWQTHVFFNNWNFTKGIFSSVKRSRKLWLLWI